MCKYHLNLQGFSIKDIQIPLILQSFGITAIQILLFLQSFGIAAIQIPMHLQGFSIKAIQIPLIFKMIKQQASKLVSQQPGRACKGDFVHNASLPARGTLNLARTLRRTLRGCCLEPHLFSFSWEVSSDPLPHAWAPRQPPPPSQQALKAIALQIQGFSIKAIQIPWIFQSCGITAIQIPLFLQSFGITSVQIPLNLQGFRIKAIQIQLILQSFGITAIQIPLLL